MVGARPAVPVPRAVRRHLDPRVRRGRPPAPRAGAASGRVFVVGRVEVWAPPHRLALTWRLPNFAPDQVTRVEVRFEPVPEGTRVTVTHRGWDSVPARHPARHGLTGHDFILMRGQWWGDILTAVRRHVQSRRVRAQAGGDQR